MEIKIPTFIFIQWNLFYFKFGLVKWFFTILNFDSILEFPSNFNKKILQVMSILNWV